MEKNESQNTGLLQLVSFLIGKEEFGIDIALVQEINRMVSITKIPNSPPHIEGVINLRGKILPVIDLRSKLGLPKKEYDKNTRIVVAEVCKKTTGFIVDAVQEVIRISRDTTEVPPSITTGRNSVYIKSVGKLDNRLLILLDLEKIITYKEEPAFA